MTIGTKIRQLREDRGMSQQELALELGISQPTVHNIETDPQHKIDCLLMDKICNFFEKDLSYFITDNVTNNNIKDNRGQVSCENFTVNNHYPESILAEIQNLIDENKVMRAKIAELEGVK
jgi:transcriptional regulator with XRE-family HTH domain